MGIAKGHKVMILSRTLWILLALPCVAFSFICPQGKQYLDVEKQKCTNCTICDHERGLLVLRPCEVHRDTICGTISDLADLTSEWHLYPTKRPKDKRRNGRNHRRHHHHHNQEERILWNVDEDELRREKKVIENNSKRHKNDGNKVRTDNNNNNKGKVTKSPVTSSGAETIIWDWQAIALTLAIFVCILFFLVIALYSFHQARQWRRLKESFEADVEELSVKLSLMSAESNEKGQNLDRKSSQIHDGNYLKSRCVYLEQLLNVRKDTKVISDKKGNVYIEEANTNGKT